MVNIILTHHLTSHIHSIRIFLSEFNNNVKELYLTRNDLISMNVSDNRVLCSLANGIRVERDRYESDRVAPNVNHRENIYGS